MTQHNQDQASQSPTSAASDRFRAQISAASMATHLATVARLSQRLEQARYEARSLIAKAG
jgi:hypothetical protein